MVGSEGDLMRKVALPCQYHLTAAGVITYLLVWGVGFNAGMVGLALLVAVGIVVAFRARKEDREAVDVTSHDTSTEA